MAGNADDVHPGFTRAAVRLLVGSLWKLGDVRMQSAFGQREHDAATTGSARRPFLKRVENAQIGDEISLPLVTAGHNLPEFALALVITSLAHPVGEFKGVVKNEALVVVEVDRNGEAGQGDEARRLRSRPVEELVAGIQGNCKQAAGSPFE